VPVGGATMLESGAIVDGNEIINKALIEVVKRPVPAK
ncbi:inositol monophosphatase, partial [Rhizobium ruizarguesonis]